MHKHQLSWSLILLVLVFQLCNSQTPSPAPASQSTSGSGTCRKSSHSSNLVHVADLSTLQFAQVIFRHGDRNPLDAYPNDPYKYPEYWHEGEGQLTKNGQRMALELGQYFRWRYDGFLDKAYFHTEVYAKSSDFDRTIMTGLGVLAGLYPPSAEPEARLTPDLNWQPIPIRTISPADDHFLAFYFENCQRYRRLLFEVASSDEIKKMDRDNQGLYEYLKKHTGLESVSWREVGILYDTFFIQTKYGLELPGWVRRVYPDQMRPLFLMGFKILSYTDEMRQLRGGPLLTEMMYNMESMIRAARGETYSHHASILATMDKHFRPAKLYMYSGHDTTITTFLATLGVYDYEHVPGYTSAVMFELHKEKVNGEYFVRLFYRNETNGKAPIELLIPNCIQDCHQSQVCRFTRFKSLMAHFNVTNWDEHCRVADDGQLMSTTEKSSRSLLDGAISASEYPIPNRYGPLCSSQPRNERHVHRANHYLVCGILATCGTTRATY